MNCPRCASTSYRKNGRRNGKQNYLCKKCGRQFLKSVYPHQLQTSFINSSNFTEIPTVKPLPEDEVTNKRLNSVHVKSPSDKMLQILLSTQKIESSALVQFMQELQSNPTPASQPDLGISILLLDAENLKLDVNTEKFLSGHCQYHLHVKIAFANWKNPSMGKQDGELYERGYQLVHVPEGKDGADAKMIAFGASILRQYPKVKEVFVCSNDRILKHLCHELQSQGLTVYWVQREANNLQIENRNTGKLSCYPMARRAGIPSFASIAQQFDDLINADWESIAENLRNLLKVAHLFQEQSNLTPNSKESPLIVQEKEAIITFFQESSTQIISETKAYEKPIKSREELEKALIEIIKRMQDSSPKVKLSVAKLGTEFRKLRGQSANSIVKKLKLGSSFTKFLKSCPIFKLKKNGKGYEVVVR